MIEHALWKSNHISLLAAPAYTVTGLFSFPAEATTVFTYFRKMNS